MIWIVTVHSNWHSKIWIITVHSNWHSKIWIVSVHSNWHSKFHFKCFFYKEFYIISFVANAYNDKYLPSFCYILGWTFRRNFHLIGKNYPQRLHYHGCFCVCKVLMTFFGVLIKCLPVGHNCWCQHHLDKLLPPAPVSVCDVFTFFEEMA